MFITGDSVNEDNEMSDIEGKKENTISIANVLSIKEEQMMKMSEINKFARLLTLKMGFWYSFLEN